MAVTLTLVTEPDDAAAATGTTGAGPSSPDMPGWLTATVRPAGSFGRNDVGRLRALLDALSSCASMVVLDLQAARLCSARAAQVVDAAADELERRGGCLLCINADDASLAHLAAAGAHAVVVPRIAS